MNKEQSKKVDLKYESDKVKNQRQPYFQIERGCIQIENYR